MNDDVYRNPLSLFDVKGKVAVITENADADDPRSGVTLDVLDAILEGRNGFGVGGRARPSRRFTCSGGTAPAGAGEGGGGGTTWHGLQ